MHYSLITGFKICILCHSIMIGSIFYVAILKGLLDVPLFFLFLFSLLLFKGFRVYCGNLLMFGRKYLRIISSFLKEKAVCRGISVIFVHDFKYTVLSLCISSIVLQFT